MKLPHLGIILKVAFCIFFAFGILRPDHFALNNLFVSDVPIPEKVLIQSTNTNDNFQLMPIPSTDTHKNFQPIPSTDTQFLADTKYQYSIPDAFLSSKVELCNFFLLKQFDITNRTFKGKKIKFELSHKGNDIKPIHNQFYLHLFQLNIVQYEKACSDMSRQQCSFFQS